MNALAPPIGPTVASTPSIYVVRGSWVSTNRPGRNIEIKRVELIGYPTYSCLPRAPLRRRQYAAPSAFILSPFTTTDNRSPYRRAGI